MDSKAPTAEELQVAMGGQQRRHKYNVGPPETRMADGRVFDSRRERDRYLQLKLLERSGVINDLELQKPYPVVVNGFKICIWKADFAYKDQSGRTCIEDAKGFKNQTYLLKKKLVEAIYGVRILET